VKSKKQVIPRACAIIEYNLEMIRTLEEKSEGQFLRRYSKKNALKLNL
jgi:hypothetical protein